MLFYVHRAYCHACLDLLIYRSNYFEAIFDHPWICPLCDEKFRSETLIQFRDNWYEFEAKLFPCIVPVQNIYSPNSKVCELRVFSAFDGIACGK